MIRYPSMKLKAGAAALLLVPIGAASDPAPTCPGPIGIASQPQQPTIVREHGRATLEFCVDEKGQLIGEPKIVQSSSNSEFDDAAIATVAGGYYSAPTVDGKPVGCCTTMQVKGLGMATPHPWPSNLISPLAPGEEVGEGSTVVQVCTDEKGHVVSEPTVLKSSGHGKLDEGAMNLAKAESGKYIPATKDGNAVPGCVKFRVKFD